MRAIPAAVQTLLKSRVMIGANSPNHKITISGAPSGASLVDPTVWTTWRTFIGSAGTPRTYGNMCETSDGKAVISYIEAGHAYIAFADSVAGVLAGTDSFGAGVDLGVFGYAQTSINLINGKLRMAISYWDSGDNKLKCQYWCDTDGTGVGMAYVSMIATNLTDGWAYSGPTRSTTLGTIFPLTDTTWIVMCPRQTYVYDQHRCCYTTNAGVSWSQGADTHANLGARMTATRGSVLKLTDTSFVTSWDSSSSSEVLQYYTNSGANRADVNWGTGWSGIYGDTPRNAAFCIVGDVSYMALRSLGGGYDILRLIADSPTIDNIVDYADWEYVASVVSDERAQPVFLLTEGALLLQHSKNDVISGAGTLAASTSLRAKRIDIQRNKGMASSATIVFGNKGGQYSPDQEAGHPWKNVMWPNANVVIEQGYGTELVTTFTGLVDDVQMTTFPAEISVVHRDYLKKALDQLITDEMGRHTITYTNESPEAIFGYLAAAAGFTTVYVEATGLILAEKTFTNETYGDGFQWLAELCGFVFYCDDYGALYYVKDDDDDPPVKDWEFTEGVDIISLRYTISDRDLYSKVIVIGDGVSYEATYYNTYNILPNKKMIIQASEATTEAQCQTIADRAIYLMNSRARICEFAAVANPYLQIGDTLRVLETTTQISELYKITDMSTSMSPDGGYIMQITCYHYASVATE